MSFYRLDPPRPGSALERDDGANGRRFVFEYVYWSRDPIFSNVNFFAAPVSFARRLQQESLTGFSLRDVETSCRDDFRQPPDKAPPEPVCQIVVTGTAGQDDFGLQTPSTLVVSERVVALMREHGIGDVRLFDYDPSWKQPSALEYLRTLKR